MRLRRRVASFAALLTAIVASAASAAVEAPAPRVFPSGTTVPQQLLRITLAFDAAQPDDVVDAVRLRQRGIDVAFPFADPPLWSSDRKTLTLLLDPSRQKRGLAGQRAYGFVLRADEGATLVLRGRPLKTWYVSVASCPPLDPARWAISGVRAGTRDALRVRFAGTIDALSRDLLAVAEPDGRRAPGTARLSGAERIWSFAPLRPWRRGARLAVHPRLEDPCGNEIGEPFEHAPGRGLGTARTTTFLRIAVLR